jgi:hypothetical protein
MFVRLSATCPATRAIAASRWSTNACLRRTSGAITHPVTTIISTSTNTSTGSYRHSTTDANVSGTSVAMTENAIVSTNSSNRVAKLSTRLVSEPAKLSWKNAASFARSSFMPTTYRFSMPRPSVLLRQWMPMRQNTSVSSSAPVNASTDGMTVVTVTGSPDANFPARFATTSGATYSTQVFPSAGSNNAGIDSRFRRPSSRR